MRTTVAAGRAGKNTLSLSGIQHRGYNQCDIFIADDNNGIKLKSNDAFAILLSNVLACIYAILRIVTAMEKPVRKAARA